MPPASYFLPTIKPVMFCKNTSGILRWQHNSMKCAPFSELSLNRMPLLAMRPAGAAESRGRDHLAGCGLHQRRSAEEDRTLVAHDDALVRHGRHVGPAGGAGAHHDRDLRNAL